MGIFPGDAPQERCMEGIWKYNTYKTPLSYFAIPANDVPAQRVSLKQQLLLRIRCHFICANVAVPSLSSSNTARENTLIMHRRKMFRAPCDGWRPKSNVLSGRSECRRVTRFVFLAQLGKNSLCISTFNVFAVFALLVWCTWMLLPYICINFILSFLL